MLFFTCSSSRSAEVSVPGPGPEMSRSKELMIYKIQNVFHDISQVRLDKLECLSEECVKILYDHRHRFAYDPRFQKLFPLLISLNAENMNEFFLGVNDTIKNIRPDVLMELLHKKQNAECKTPAIAVAYAVVCKDEPTAPAAIKMSTL